MLLLLFVPVCCCSQFVSQCVAALSFRPIVLLLLLVFVPMCFCCSSVRPNVLLLLLVFVPVYCFSRCASQCVAAHIFRPSVLLLILFVPVCCYTLSVRPSVLLLSVCVPVYCCSYCSSQCVAAHIFRPSVLLYSQCACPGVSEAVFKVPPSKREDGAGPGEAASPSSLYIYTASSQGPRRSFSAPPPPPPSVGGRPQIE